MRIIDYKKNYVPVRRIGTSVTICFDYEPIVKNGVETDFASWMMHTFVTTTNMRDLKEYVLSSINKQVDNAILSGFKWNGMNIWLSSENQFNYKAAYDIAFQTNGTSLPVVFKFGSTDNPIYYKFETMEELTDFYMKAMTYINEQLAIGWAKKDAIDWSVYERALAEL